MKYFVCLYELHSEHDGKRRVASIQKTVILYLEHNEGIQEFMGFALTLNS